MGLTISVEEAFSQRRGLLAAFLDVDSAFPSVVPSILLDRLAKLGVSLPMLKYVKHCTFERSVYSDKLGNGYRTLSRGLPQGGVLSPLLYSLYVADICKGVPRSVTVSQFADDLAVYCSRKSVESCKNLLLKAIDAIYVNLWELGLDLSPSKTVLIYFNKLGHKPGEMALNIRGAYVRSSETVKFLGITFDYRLNFHEHVTGIRDRCKRALNIVKFVRGTWWGAEPSTLLTLYISFVRSIMDYGSFVYCPSAQNVRNKLESVQLSAIRMALGLRVSTPTNVVLAESKLVRVADRAAFLGRKYLHKVLSNSRLHISAVVNRLIGKMRARKYRNKFRGRVLFDCIREAALDVGDAFRSERFVVYDTPYEVLNYDVFVDLQIGGEIRAASDPNAALDGFIRDSGGMPWYTDGSKARDGGVGCACYSPVSGCIITRCLDPRSSVFTAECIALRDAVEMAGRGEGSNVLVFSDSLSALMALRSARNDAGINPYILEVRRLAYEFEVKSGSLFQVKFCWIPAHIGLRGNEHVDMLAKTAAGGEPDRSAPVPFSDLAELARGNAHSDTLLYVMTLGDSKGIAYTDSYLDGRRWPWF